MYISPPNSLDVRILNLMYERGTSILQSLPDTTKADIYVISIYVDEDLLPDEITQIRLGYNTKSRWLSCCPKPGQAARWPIASSAGEARWNYAFWLQDQSEQPLFGDHRRRNDEELRKEWMHSHEFYFTDEDRETDFDRYCDLSDRCLKRLWELAVSFGKRFRDEDFIRKIFGEDLPIIIHEVHMDGREGDYVRWLNPDGQADDYLNGWIAVDPYTGNRATG
jgi:hypothetical protein